ncbi:MAG: DNA repair protein RecO [Bacteroidota bacterium]|nr:DNA repair protein RecO [Bacteroidota bacterium]MDW8137571.1 DNA repair protein RecO [Bacteroidota bacterium]
MIRKTDALVLRALDYGETSRIVTLYSRRFGKLTLMAKGARRPGSRLAACLEPLAYIEAVFYYRAGRELQYLSDCAFIRPMPRWGEDVERAALGSFLLEWLDRLTPEGEPNPMLFNWALRALASIYEGRGQKRTWALLFLLRALPLIGYTLRIEAEAGCSGPGSWVLEAAHGRIAPQGGVETYARPISAAAVRLLEPLLRDPVERIQHLVVPAGVWDELVGHVYAFVQAHLGPLPQVRSWEVLRSMLIRERGEAL